MDQLNDTTLLLSKKPEESPNSCYEHFPIVCPTCEGKGEIEDDGMVTFIRVKDRRLRPARTKLKIFLLTVFVLGLGGIAVYFIYPRDTTLELYSCDVKNFSLNATTPWMVYEVAVLVKNNNYFAITLQNTTVQLSFNQYMIASNGTQRDIEVSLRSSDIVKVSLNASYERNNAAYIRNTCQQHKYLIGQLLQINSELSYWLHSEHIEGRDIYFYVDCAKLVFPWPLAAYTNLPIFTNV